jgi:hypothetical protein
MYRVRKPELFDHEEQEEHDREAGDKKILSQLQKAYCAQGDKSLNGQGQ